MVSNICDETICKLILSQITDRVLNMSLAIIFIWWFSVKSPNVHVFLNKVLPAIKYKEETLIKFTFHFLWTYLRHSVVLWGWLRKIMVVRDQKGRKNQVYNWLDLTKNNTKNGYYLTSNIIHLIGNYASGRREGYSL